MLRVTLVGVLLHKSVGDSRVRRLASVPTCICTLQSLLKMYTLIFILPKVIIRVLEI